MPRFGCAAPGFSLERGSHVDPAAQRSGVGRALMARVIADAATAAVPIYLETAKPDNVPYYRSFGFVETGREKLPRGASLWLMLRPHS